MLQKAKSKRDIILDTRIVFRAMRNMNLFDITLAAIFIVLENILGSASHVKLFQVLNDRRFIKCKKLRLLQQKLSFLLRNMCNGEPNCWNCVSNIIEMHLNNSACRNLLHILCLFLKIYRVGGIFFKL